jgi:inosine/guanosine/xanthosine phosphorylase family protein
MKLRAIASAANLDPRKTAARLRELCPRRPALAVVLGSGFQHALDRMRVAAAVPYASLPGFPPTAIAGHAGRAVFGHFGATPVLALCGRAHFYEGHALEIVTFPVRVLAALGVPALLLTNAAGAIHRRFRPGDFMALTDHINFLGANPLRGDAPPGAERFVDLSEVYDPRLVRYLKAAAKKARARLHTGVYLAVAGPSYETPAEIRAFARLGADAVGMSTVPEAIVARQCGLRVAGLSCLTNLAAGRGRGALSHAEVLAAGRQAGRTAAELLRYFVEFYARGG